MTLSRISAKFVVGGKFFATEKNNSFFCFYDFSCLFEFFGVSSFFEDEQVLLQVPDDLCRRLGRLPEQRHLRGEHLAAGRSETRRPSNDKRKSETKHNRVHCRATTKEMGSIAAWQQLFTEKTGKFWSRSLFFPIVTIPDAISTEVFQAFNVICAQ